jgi:hypothetical protein
VLCVLGAGGGVTAGVRGDLKEGEGVGQLAVAMCAPGQHQLAGEAVLPDTCVVFQTTNMHRLVMPGILAPEGRSRVFEGWGGGMWGGGGALHEGGGARLP